MVNRGVNPYVSDCDGKSEFGHYEDLSNLSSLPTSKSIFFSIEPFECFCDTKCDSDLPNPWFYQNGVFNGQFDCRIGKGASGTVLHGFCHGVEAAFKFIDVGEQKFKKKVQEHLVDLNRKLAEMKKVQTTIGSKIVKFYGHFR